MESIDQLVAQYGLWAVFLGCFLEGESIAVTAGVLAHRHLLVFPQAVMAVALGAWCADVFFFWIGRRFRDATLVTRLRKTRGIEKVLAMVGRGPLKFAAVFRFIPGMRILGPLALAQSSISTMAYPGLTAVSSALWALVYTSTGHLLGTLIARLFGHMHRTELILAVAGAVFAGGLILSILHMRRRRQPR